MGRLTEEARGYLDDRLKEAELKGRGPVRYDQLRLAVRQKFGLDISKATISKRAKVLGMRIQRGRKRTSTRLKTPSHSLSLDYAGGFFLKGAELMTGLLGTINHLLEANTDSHRAKKALNLARKINAILLYAPLFGYKQAEEITDFPRRELCYLAGVKQLPDKKEIAQYLEFLKETNLLLYINKEVMKNSQQAAFLRIDFNGKAFYLDAQTHTVWPSPKIPQSFSTTLSEARSYVNNVFLSPSAQRPLILQACPGYNTLPEEMWKLMRCFEHSAETPITRIAIEDGSGKELAVWRNIKHRTKCYFLAPLSPWQYTQLRGIQMVREFQPAKLGPEQESVSIAEANVNLTNTQLSENIIVRIVLIKRKQERLALITNIHSKEERYIRRIAELYFWRWPDTKAKHFYDLLEVAHQEMLERKKAQKFEPSQSPLALRPAKDPFAGFKLLLGHLHHHALNSFFSARFSHNDLTAATDQFYRYPGYIRRTRRLTEIIYITPCFT
ncbi:hypothetical protein ACFL1I_06560 [Candidatus Omnitrophota bacterium]